MAQVKCLITSNAAHGAINLDVNSIDKLGNTTLHYIMGWYDFDPWSNRDKVLEILDVGGNPNLTNKEGHRKTLCPVFLNDKDPLNFDKETGQRVLAF